MQIGMALSICVISSLKSGFRMGFRGWDIFQVLFSTEKHHCGGICPPIGLHSLEIPPELSFGAIRFFWSLGDYNMKAEFEGISYQNGNKDCNLTPTLKQIWGKSDSRSRIRWVEVKCVRWFWTSMSTVTADTKASWWRKSHSLAVGWRIFWLMILLESVDNPRK